MFHVKQFGFCLIWAVKVKHLEGRIYWIAYKKQIQNVGLRKNHRRAFELERTDKYCIKHDLGFYNPFSCMGLYKLFHVKQFCSGFYNTLDGSAFFANRCFLRKIESMKISLGFMPEIREACPRVAGRILESFSRASFFSPDTAA